MTNIKDILREAMNYSNSIITNSAAKRTSTPSEINEINERIRTMRTSILKTCQQVDPSITPRNLESGKGFTDEKILLIKQKYIEKYNMGNCGEFVALTITYLLNNYQHELYNAYIDVWASGRKGDNPTHVYLRIWDFEHTDVCMDPTAGAIFDRVKAKWVGTVFFQGGRSNCPNRYEVFSENSTLYEEKRLGTVIPSDYNRSLGPKFHAHVDWLVSIDNELEQPNTTIKQQR
ncbi:Uncharacterised protein [Legionella beliardensis]|uniref:Uncharacterized protein n=1 Tax=Legionella beliardensis TaxID=91822 RepID=A0A378I3R9_9GAMM|nr:hypothetical protein [Legionella beliardensis]STX29818.1 Uncharacterised protein [Legionella beliardensis]